MKKGAALSRETQERKEREEKEEGEEKEHGSRSVPRQRSARTLSHKILTFSHSCLKTKHHGQRTERAATREGQDVGSREERVLGGPAESSQHHPVAVSSSEPALNDS